MTNRRSFITTAATATVAAVTIPGLISSAFAESSAKSKIKLNSGDTVLFQGDSITDWGRDKNTHDANNFNTFGNGYVLTAAGTLLNKYADKNLKIYNKGISGNKVYQLAERWDADCLDLKPNVLSILIGVNDFWHTLTNGYKGTSQVYVADLRKLLDRTKQVLPNIQLIIGEPFAVKGVKAVDDKWYPAFDEYRAASKQIAADYNAVFIPYQTIFDKALSIAPGSYWTIDGVHPSVAGANLMAQAWLETVKG
ncbi:SGNH/GDSL hydrolase family protein [Mucilaginibacter ginkgonis]|uniref:SGNH/GDSL hydrolase family protein n=1 Tax=Mucilaginibacter ginkgonis TaxID=2682091 RepID=A0A6I4I6Z6_9SPHI|nr:SGNH/GDSL hydrolase family protein [Mucilaginibacter ginkgonis]QQL50725.1 SGNH/GDSL hydrolase family protein [Mucilaginibacter ginkgonis]